MEEGEEERGRGVEEEVEEEEEEEEALIPSDDLLLYYYIHYYSAPDVLLSYIHIIQLTLISSSAPHH